MYVQGCVCTGMHKDAPVTGNTAWEIVLPKRSRGSVLQPFFLWTFVLGGALGAPRVSLQMGRVHSQALDISWAENCLGRGHVPFHQAWDPVTDGLQRIKI